MSTKYVLQYRYETIGDGEWKHEFESPVFQSVKDKMVEHIAEFEELECRIIEREYTVKERELGSYVPAQTWREEES